MNSFDLPSFPLSGKTALVTGASRGIGRAIAQALAEAGAAVAVNYASGASAAAEVVEGLRAAGRQAMAVQADIGRIADHPGLLAVVTKALGPIDILVNNAAVEMRAAVLNATEAEWDRTLAVNLKGVYFLTQAVARAMIAHNLRGRIINVSSTHESRPLANASIYSISKGGLAMLTRSFALELAPHGITVNALLPGAIQTDINRVVLADPEYASRVRARIPLGRIGMPDDVAGAAVFLASPASAYMTGANLIIDGGFTL